MKPGSDGPCRWRKPAWWLAVPDVSPHQIFDLAAAELPARSRSRTSADRRSPIVDALKSTEEAGDPTAFGRDHGTYWIDRLSEVLQCNAETTQM